MAKTHRGQGVRKSPESKRGACPTCSRTGVKLLWESKSGDTKAKVCKHCRTKKK